MNSIKIDDCEFVAWMYIPNPKAYCSYQAYDRLYRFKEENDRLREAIKGFIETSRENANDYEYGEKGHYYWKEKIEKALK